MEQSCFCHFGAPIQDSGTLTNLLANLHVLLEAMDGFSGDNGTGGTNHLSSLRDGTLPLRVRKSTFEKKKTFIVIIHSKSFLFLK